MPAVAIDAHCSLDRVREHEQVAQLARAVAHVVGRAAPRARSRARGTSRSSASWSAITSTTSFASPSSSASRIAWRASARPTPRPRWSGSTTSAPRRRGSTSRAAGSPRRSRRPRRPRPRSSARRPGRAQAATTSGSATSSFRKVRSASGIASRKRSSAAPVARARCGGSPSCLLAVGAFVAVRRDPFGQARHRVLERPTCRSPNVTWPPGSRSSSRRAGSPTSAQRGLGGGRRHDVVALGHRDEHVAARVAEARSTRPPSADRPAHQRVLADELARRPGGRPRRGTARGRASTAPSPGSPRRTRRSRGARAASPSARSPSSARACRSRCRARRPGRCRCRR